MRERRALEGLTELRGAFVPVGQHTAAKTLLANWIEGGCKSPVAKKPKG